MSIVRWPGLVPRMWRSIDSVNGFADTFESAGALDSPNFAEEGLDRPVLDANLNGVKLFEKKEGTRYTVAAAGAPTASGGGAPTWLVWNPSGANPLEDLSGFSLGADDVAIVHGLVMLSSDAASFGLDVDTMLRLRIGWNYGGGGGTTTARGTATLANGVRTNGATKLHGVLRTFVVIPGPVSVNWIRLEYALFRTTATTPLPLYASPEKSSFMGFKYKRCRP